MPFVFPLEPTLSHVDREILLSRRFQDGGGFPPSYVRFILQAGWGRTAGMWLVYPPVLAGFADGLQGRGRKLTDDFRETYRQNQEDGFDFTLEPHGAWGTPDQLEVFAYSENGDALLWQVTMRQGTGEFPVWLSANVNSLEVVGQSLDDALVTLRLRESDSDLIAVEPLPAVRL